MDWHNYFSFLVIFFIQSSIDRRSVFLSTSAKIIFAPLISTTFAQATKEFGIITSSSAFKSKDFNIPITAFVHELVNRQLFLENLFAIFFLLLQIGPDVRNVL